MNLSILRMVEEYKRIPRGLLYEKLDAPDTEIDKQLTDLQNRGAITVENDHVVVRGR